MADFRKNATIVWACSLGDAGTRKCCLTCEQVLAGKVPAHARCRKSAEQGSVAVVGAEVRLTGFAAGGVEVRVKAGYRVAFGRDDLHPLIHAKAAQRLADLAADGRPVKRRVLNGYQPFLRIRNNQVKVFTLGA